MKSRTFILILAPVMLALLLTACENSYLSCLRGNGFIERDTLELSEFTGIVTEGDFEVYYIPDTVHFRVLETDQNLIPYIRSRVMGNTLYVDNGTRKCLRSEYPIRIFVHAPEVNLMRLAGSGMISAESVYTDELDLQIEGSGVIEIRGIDVLDLHVLITGSGEAELWGKTDVAGYTISGSGTISAQNLQSKTCVADISGSGTIYCHATETLQAIISGSGTIYYRGNPQISTKISGSGSVKTMK
jgi:hypothetical protein